MLRAGRGKKGGKHAWKEEMPLFPNLEEEKQPFGENGGGDSTKNSPDPGVTHPCAGGSWWPWEGECPTAPSPAQGEAKAGIAFLGAQGGFSLTCPFTAIPAPAENLHLRGNFSL